MSWKEMCRQVGPACYEMDGLNASVRLFLSEKLMEDASGKYLVGQDTSPMRKPKWMACTSISLSKTKSSEQTRNGSRSSKARFQARYPVWYSDSFCPNPACAVVVAAVGVKTAVAAVAVKTV